MGHHTDAMGNAITHETTKVLPKETLDIGVLMPGIDAQINSASQNFEKNNIAKETPDQVAEHIGSIFRSYNIRGILADNLIS